MNAIRLLALSALMIVSACATPNEFTRPQAVLVVTSQSGEVLTAAPGETVYREVSDVVSWELAFDQDTQVGPYTIEAGAYPLVGTSGNGYFFGIGDGCIGEPAVTVGRFSSAPEHLLLSRDESRLCVTSVYDPARCRPSPATLRTAGETDGDEIEHELIYLGVTTSEADAPPVARFNLVSHRLGTRTDSEVQAEAPGVLEIGDGIFQILSADETGVVMRFYRPILTNPALADLSIEPSDVDPWDAVFDFMALEQDSGIDAAEHLEETADAASQRVEDDGHADAPMVGAGVVEGEDPGSTPEG
jgi:hypothetical protein